MKKVETRAGAQLMLKFCTPSAGPTTEPETCRPSAQLTTTRMEPDCTRQLNEITWNGDLAKYWQLEERTP